MEQIPSFRVRLVEILGHAHVLGALAGEKKSENSHSSPQVKEVRVFYPQNPISGSRMGGFSHRTAFLPKPDLSSEPFPALQVDKATQAWIW
jgi:hypothetical protein